MKHLEPYDFTPDFQPVEADPVSFRLKPFDFAGQGDFQAYLNTLGKPTFDGIKVAAKYVVGWSGGGLGTYSRAAMNQLLSGSSNTNFLLWMYAVAGDLYGKSLMGDEDAKKS